MFHHAEIYFPNTRGNHVMNWIAAELRRRVPFTVARLGPEDGDVIPPIRVETKPVAIAVELEENGDFARESVANEAVVLRAVLLPDEYSVFAASTAVLRVGMADHVEPAIVDNVIVNAERCLVYPGAPEVRAVLETVAELLRGTIVDWGNSRVRVAGSRQWRNLPVDEWDEVAS